MQSFLAAALAVTGCLSVLATLPQLIRLLRIKRSDEFSLFSWIIWLLYQAVALAYTIAIAKPVYAVINGLWVVFYTAMIWLILRYRLGPGR